MSPPTMTAGNVLTKPRPKHPPRMGSFKRHASVDGLREVPLPGGDGSNSTVSKLTKKSRDSSGEQHVDDDWENIGALSLEATPTPKTETILPYARPYSQPPSSPAPPPDSSMSRDRDIHAQDRMSSASLPLPSQIPFHALPRAAQTIPEEQEISSTAAPAAPPTPTLTSPTTTAPVARPFSLPPTAIPRPPSITRQRPSTASSSSTASNSPSFPPPEPPTILGPTPSSEPHAPFLAPTPPPADAWIEVETTPSQYRLNVRLPGFKRDAITLATKKRRVLHVVADSWEAGGGHFERRISFGYDADLVSVRAEFDGEMLRIIVPRRVSMNGFS